MKSKLLFIVLIYVSACFCQESKLTNLTYENFEEQLIVYEAIQNQTVSKKDYNYGVMIINETKNAVNGDPAIFNRADYFNILTSFLSLKESIPNIMLAFEKFKKSDGSCEYFIAFEDHVAENSKFDIIRIEYNSFVSKCKNQVIESEFNIENYISENGFNSELVMLIQKIFLDDQKYRNTEEKNSKLIQIELDRKNWLLIDSLFNNYKTYIGNSLVGEEFEDVMWLVIQHSNIEMMGRYLPIIKKAIEDEELDVVPLKMLIDRFYGLKYGYQIFGSQGDGFGFEMADEKTRLEIRKEYGIEKRK